MKHIIYCIDLDGTLYDNTHRQHLIPEDRSCTDSWSAFNCACRDDKVRHGVLGIVKSLIAAGQDVRFLTGRGAVAKDPTMEALVQDLERSRSMISLTMRDMKDYRPGWVMKREVVLRWLQANPACEVVMLEDDPEIVSALRAMDRVTVLQIDSLCADIRTKHV